MAGINEGRVAIVTGAGRGIGRGEALEFARQGAKVVVNDIGGATDGTGSDRGPAQQVVDEIVAMGGQAVANTEDVSDYEGAADIVRQAIETFGRLDIVVNNAGILRDRMLINMGPDEWDAVIRVHLRSTYAMTHHAAAYWREQSKNGVEVDARVINTSSSSGIYGNVGQTNYGAAKAGIAAFTIIAGKELERYGVTVNAIAPGAFTRMTQGLIPDDRADQMAPEAIAPLVVWLASPEAKAINGRVFNVAGGHISVAEGWVAGPAADTEGMWETAKLGEVVPGLVARARANSLTSGQTPQ
ncbi:MAG: SDR family NAD(P)-dependent oxidoreductase [Frankiaceae bacterium]|jgi:NAD(P)-dependent dehydrogenase (short-subunit alcohol dehydrogenase family)|nr:SDR family NAD(P)-dependent oxidoreductase [Frankiaceae bacterium]